MALDTRPFQNGVGIIFSELWKIGRLLVGVGEVG